MAMTPKTSQRKLNLGGLSKAARLHTPILLSTTLHPFAPPHAAPSQRRRFYMGRRPEHMARVIGDHDHLAHWQVAAQREIGLLVTITVIV